MDIFLSNQPRQGIKSLVTLRSPIRVKVGGSYSCIHGAVWAGYFDTDDCTSSCVRIGEITDTGNHIIIPISNISGIQECNKVLKGDDILVLE